MNNRKMVIAEQLSKQAKSSKVFIKQSILQYIG